MNILGLDIGFSRVGVAFGDTHFRMAFPQKILAFDDNILQEIQKICVEKKVEKIVAGLPLPLSGEKTLHTHKTEEFAEKLQQFLGIPLVLINEQFSTKSAEKSLHFAGYNNKNQKDKKDAVAAAFILQTFLDQNFLDLK